MKKITYISLLFLISFFVFNCAGEGKNYDYLEETFEEDSLVIDLIKHVDSMVVELEPTVEKSKKTEVAVKNTAKREKKLKKELKKTKKELQKTKKNLEKTQKELAQIKKMAGKRNLIQKVFNVEVDSVEVTDEGTPDNKAFDL